MPPRSRCTLLMLCSVACAGAQTTPRGQAGRDLHIARVTTAPVLDDYIKGAPPDGAMPVTGFIQRNPDDGKPATSTTNAWLAYDATNLYVIFVCQSSPGELRARYTKRDDIFADDFVGVLLDTFDDHQHAFEFLTNPYGIQLDGINTEGQGDDWNFDTYWKSEGRVTRDGYAVRMAIPFKSLRFTSMDMQTWGFAFVRNIPARSENAFWPSVTNRVSGFVPQFGQLDGFDNISPGRNIRLIPYVAGSSAHLLDQPAGQSQDQAPLFRTNRDLRVGMDVKLVIRESLTLDATVNPDFSQVESDDPQVTVNQRFEVFFPEKRPFFLENASYFQTPENLFFSRRIADPLGGVRLTGRIGRWSIGLLAGADRDPGKRVDLADPRSGDYAPGGVVRIQRNIGKESTVGVFLSDYNFGASHNRVGSVDARWKIAKNWVATGQAIASATRYLDGTRSAGPAYLAFVNRNGLHFNYFGNYVDRNPGFHTDLGFVPRTDIRMTTQNANYNWRPKATPVADFGFSSFSNGDWNRQNVFQDGDTGATFFLNCRRATGFNINHIWAYELYQGIGFHKSATEMSFYSDRFKRVGINAFFGTGTGVNYSPAAGVYASLASNQYGNATITLRPNARLRIQQTYFYTRLAHVFTNHIFRNTVNYQFTPALSLHAIIDYNAVLSNPAVASYDTSKKFTGDLLIAYLPYPGTAVYLGYTNGRENLALLGEPATLLRTSNPDLQTVAQVFVKVSYLFRF
jgi:Domain of unknown function (DUF5916)/Carbohydrate family 9 binding domain-like